jgi:transcriptional regulator with XRE-family HTH domain
MQNLAEVLSKWRFISRLSVRDAAARVGLDAATYSRLERGIEVSASTLRTVLFWLLRSEAATANVEVPMSRSGQSPDAGDGEATTNESRGFPQTSMQPGSGDRPR